MTDQVPEQEKATSQDTDAPEAPAESASPQDAKANPETGPIESPEESQELEAVDAEATENDDVIKEHDPVAELKNQINELQQNLLRKQADFDNFRKRMRREMEEAGSRALVRFVRPLLTEMDNFGLAIDNANPEQFGEFAMGVSMIKQNIDNLFNGAGIQAIPSEGIFDPAKHEVLSEMPNDELPRGSIVEVFRQGYQLGDQVIRAAQVVVSKPSEPAPETQASQDDGNTGE